MSPESRAIMLFFSKAMNTNDIAAYLGKTEPWVDRVIAAELDRHAAPKGVKATRDEALKLP